MERIALAIFKLLTKNSRFRQAHAKFVKKVAVGFDQYASVYCNKNGFPKKENGSAMNTAELYDYFLQSDQYETYTNHASKL